LQDAAGTLNNLKYLWTPDLVIVALDINFFQEQLFPAAKKLGMKYICITPLESDPLCLTWAQLLNEMNKVFFISQFGTDEAIKAGVDAEHIEIGIDTVSWRLRTKEEYDQVRKTMGFVEDDFVVMTVADNQERKNLSRGLEVIAELKKRGVSVRHILVTREHSMVGWKLYDLAFQLGVSSELRVFQNGIPFRDLYAMYCAADAFLLCSKGEGLGLPLMESMCIGVPVVANRTGAIPELLGNSERGWIIDNDYMMIDPFGNQNRYFASAKDAADKLDYIRKNPDEVAKRTKLAREFMEGKDWNKSAKQLDNAIQRIANEAKEAN
jgi:glycosyltransferase involved in cell wall biosynthesis